MFEGSICVCCMSTDNLFDLFSDRKIENEVENFGEMLTAAFNIRLSETNTLNSICFECVAKVKECLDFKRNALKCIALLSSVDLSDLLSHQEIEVLGLNPKKSEDTKKFDSTCNIQNEDTKAYLESTAETRDDDVRTDDQCREIIDELKITISPCTTDNSFKHEEQCIENLEPAPKQNIGRQKRPPDNVPYKVNEDELTCRECGKDFESNKTLKIHYNTHFGHHQCNVCDKKFMIFYNLKKHEESHQRGPFQCTSCEKQFYNVNTLKSHKRLKHSTRPPYPCKLCDKAFTTLKLRFDHLEREHAIKETKYKCKYCDKMFRNASDRWKHISYNHEIKWLSCPVCGAKCRKTYLRQHVRRHTRVKNSDEAEGFGERNEAEKRFICKLCNQAFAQKVSLKYHIGTHVREMEYSGDADFLVLDKHNNLGAKDKGLLSIENGSTQESEIDSYIEPDFEFHLENSDSDLSVVEEEDVPLIRTDIGFTSDFDE